MTIFDLIKPGILLWVDGQRGHYDGSTSNWSCPFRIISIEETTENHIKTKVYDYDDMAERTFTFCVDSNSERRICDPIEIKKYIIKKKSKLNSKIEQLKNEIEVLNIDLEIMDNEIKKLN